MAWLYSSPPAEFKLFSPISFFKEIEKEEVKLPLL
jgi:hypothetical protein